MLLRKASETWPNGSKPAAMPAWYIEAAGVPVGRIWLMYFPLSSRMAPYEGISTSIGPSNIPPPPRMTVLRLSHGVQANPTRGEQYVRCLSGEGSASESTRPPKSKVSLGETFQVS